MLCREKGFTLIELLVVMAVIGVLAAGIIAAINPGAQIAKARDSQRKSDLKQIANALERYATLNGRYPSTNGELWSEGNCTNFPETTIKPSYSGSNAYIPDLAPQELKLLPGDPNVDGVQKRCYVYWSNGTDYLIWAHAGAEAPFQPNDPMIRLLPSACTTTQATFVISSLGRCASN